VSKRKTHPSEKRTEQHPAPLVCLPSHPSVNSSVQCPTTCVSWFLLIGTKEVMENENRGADYSYRGFTAGVFVTSCSTARGR